MTTHSARRSYPSVRSSCFSLLLVLVFATISPRQAASAASASKKLKPTDPYALIFGTVWGPTDHPVYGIRVLIRRASDKKARWELYSDHAGEFAQRVPAGKNDYVVTADLKHVKAEDGQPVHLAEEVPVHVEYDERVDISLHLAR